MNEPVEIPDELAEALNESIRKYADRLGSMGVREILNSDYEAPTVLNGTDWIEAAPGAEELIQLWKTAMREWRQRYGDMEGYNEFSRYWAISRMKGVADLIGDATAFQVFLGPTFRTLRDKFGFASDYELATMGPEEIARYGKAADRERDYERQREEREWGSAWRQVYDYQVDEAKRAEFRR